MNNCVEENKKNLEKQKMTSAEIINYMKNNLGISFNKMTDKEAELFLKTKNNYMRTASYRKNYEKYQLGKNKGKYINLDFDYLIEFSKIDAKLRYLVCKISLDIEHSIKVAILSDIEEAEDDGYTLIGNFLSKYKYILKKIKNNRKSEYTGGLISKYMDFSDSINETNEEIKYEGRCPAWVFVELLSFGDLMRFYTYYYHDVNNKTGRNVVSVKMLNSLKSLRNAAAHNNCLLINLKGSRNTKPSDFFLKEIRSIDGVTKSACTKKLSSRIIMEFSILMYIFSEVVPANMTKTRCDEIEELVFNRMLINESDFFENDLIKNSASFIKKIIRHYLIKIENKRSI